MSAMCRVCADEGSCEHEGTVASRVQTTFATQHHMIIYSVDPTYEDHAQITASHR